jgi:hypothetical protein
MGTRIGRGSERLALPVRPGELSSHEAIQGRSTTSHGPRVSLRASMAPNCGRGAGLALDRSFEHPPPARRVPALVDLFVVVGLEGESALYRYRNCPSPVHLTPVHLRPSSPRFIESALYCYRNCPSPRFTPCYRNCPSPGSLTPVHSPRFISPRFVTLSSPYRMRVTTSRNVQLA